MARVFFFFSSRRRHTRLQGDWSSDVCSSDLKPWDPSRRQVWWNDAQQKWVGNDVPDIKADSKPADHMGPFIMNPEGVGRIFAPLGALADGPFPTHYEPTESPVDNLLHPKQTHNPIAKV